MKFLVFFLIIPLIFITNIFSQVEDMPDDIGTFYRDKNFVNTFTLREERSMILIQLTKIAKEDSANRFEDPRIRRAAGLLREMMQKFLPVSDNMNTGQAYPFQLVLPEINHVKDWTRKDNHIQVSLYTYSLEPEANSYYVASYSENLNPEDYDPVDPSDLKYISQEIHDWYLEGNRWYKTSVNKILVK